MDETKQVETLSAIAEVEAQRARARAKPAIASVRVSPGPYFALASVLTFCSALLLRSDHNGWALVLIGVAWLVIPIFALSDRIAFDGQSLRRQGPISFLLKLLRIYRKELAVEDLKLLKRLLSGL